MTKYIETIDVEPTVTKTVFVEDQEFSWTPQNNRLSELGAIEVPEKKDSKQKAQ